MDQEIIDNMDYLATLILTREDLILESKNKNVEDIQFHDFKSIIYNRIKTASFVLFVDGKAKVIKSRWIIIN